MIYLDNASTTKTDDRVLDAMEPYLREQYGNAGTLYKLGRDAAFAVATARKQVADFIGASPDQIIFTSGGSEANNLVIFGLKKYLLSHEGHAILTSQIEHDSILRSVDEVRASSDGIIGGYNIPPYDNGTVGADMVKLFLENSRFKIGLVSIMHTNNETGIENDIPSIGKLCNERGILFHTDCVQAAGCAHIDVKQINCDFLSLSSHKIHGSKGVGALFVKNKALLSPVTFGGKSQEFGLRGGTENVAGVVGFGKACEILQQEESETIQYVSGLRKFLYESIKIRMHELGGEDMFKLNGDIDLYEQNGKTMSVSFDGVDAETLVLLLDAKGVCVSAGSACRSHESVPSRTLTSMGISPERARSSIRLSVSRMNTTDEILSAARTIASCVMLLRQK